MGSGDARFSCPACSKSYRWKTEIAGRKVKCNCGHVMLAPRDVAAQVEDDLIPLADENSAAHSVAGHQIMAATAVGAPAIAARPSPKPKGQSKNGLCPACNRKLPSGAVVCVKCGMNLATGQKMQTTAAEPIVAAAPTIPYAGKVPLAQREKEARNDVYFANKAKDLWVPVGMIAFSVAVFFFVFHKAFAGNFAAVGTALGIYVVLGTGILVVGAFAAAAILDIGFGPFGVAVLKLCAVALLPAALSEAVNVLPMDAVSRSAIGWALSTLVYFFMLMWLFDLDGRETLNLIFVFLVVRFLSGILLAFVAGALIGSAL